MSDTELIHYDVHHMLKEIELCVENKCYFAALSTALILPDICGKIFKKNRINEVHGNPYVDWCNTWLHPYLPSLCLANYGKPTWGTIIYKLRCSILHNGELDVCGKKYQWFDLVKFKFYMNGKPWYAEPLTIMQETATGGLKHKNEIYINIDIRFLIQAIINAVLAFEKELDLNQNDFPSIDITVKP